MVFDEATFLRTSAATGSVNGLLFSIRLCLEGVQMLGDVEGAFILDLYIRLSGLSD
jgi:hypothetical protein